MLVIFKAPGANVISTVDDIRKQLPKLQANIPQGIKVHVLMDRTQTIRAAVRDVETTLVITVALVVIVIYLFLLNVRATLIPSAVIPLALLARPPSCCRPATASTTCRSWPSASPSASSSTTPSSWWR